MEEKVSFKINAILLRKFSLDLKNEYLKAQFENPGKFEYTFEVNTTRTGVVDKNLFIVAVYLRVFMDKEKKTELANIDIDNVFELADLINYYDKENNLINLPGNIESSLIGISLSHARAIFITKSAGTFLQDAILPVMNPGEFMKSEKDK